MIEEFLIAKLSLEFSRECEAREMKSNEKWGARRMGQIFELKRHVEGDFRQQELISLKK